MASVPVEILLGIYLGVLTGIIPGLVSWSLGFVFKYFTGVSIPGLGVVALAVALAGVNGGLLALADPSVTQSANAVTVTTAIIVVLLIALYAHSRGDAMGATFPKRLSWKQLREQTLSTDVLGSLSGRDEVRVRVVGEVADMEGYPPLSDDLRGAVRDSEWTFPADLRVSEIEERLAERLRTEFDLGDVTVSVDEGGRAAVVAAPPFSGLSKRVPDGKRAVSVAALVPTGLARNDEVTLITPDAQVRGTVLSAKSQATPSDVGPGPNAERDGSEDPDDPDEASVPQPVRAPTTTGGEGRVTVAVTRTDAGPLVRADRARVVVESRGVRREYELVSLLRRAGRRFRRVTVGAGGPLDGTALGTAAVRHQHGVAVVAVNDGNVWRLAPGGDTELSVGDEVFAVGTREAVPGGLPILVGLSGVAVYLNSTRALRQVIGNTGDPLDETVALFNIAVVLVSLFAARMGRDVGDRVGTDVFTGTGERVEGELSRVVQAVGRVITVELPEEVEDLVGYDPVPEETKTKLAGKSFVFPRRLTVAELRDRLVTRLKADYAVGHVDIDLAADGSVEYLALGSRAAGIGPTLPPETSAVAVRADPAFAASAGDIVQVWRTDPPERVLTAELRGTVDDIVTLAVDAADTRTLADDETYRLVTLPVESRPDREFASLLRAADETMATVTVAEGSLLAGQPVGALQASIVAVRPTEGPVEALPGRDRVLAPGDLLYMVATPETIRRVDGAARPATRDATDAGTPQSGSEMPPDRRVDATTPVAGESDRASPSSPDAADPSPPDPDAPGIETLEPEDGSTDERGADTPADEDGPGQDDAAQSEDRDEQHGDEATESEEKPEPDGAVDKGPVLDLDDPDLASLDDDAEKLDDLPVQDGDDGVVDAGNGDGAGTGTGDGDGTGADDESDGDWTDVTDEEAVAPSESADPTTEDLADLPGTDPDELTGTDPADGDDEDGSESGRPSEPS